MGKTLKRQRQKQAREQQQQQQQQQQRPSKLPRLANGAPLNAGSSSSKFTAAVSAALQDKRWQEAVTVLEAMQQFGKVPKLGAVQRWVRDADQAGSVPVTARLLDAILRCTVTPPTTPPAPAAGPLKGSVVRHPPWRPAAAPLAAAAAAAAAPAEPAAPAAADAVQQQHTGVSGPPDDAHTVGQQQQQEEEQPQPGPSQPPPPSQQPPQPQPQPQADGVTAAAAAGEAALTTAQLQGLLYQVPFKAGAGGPDAIYAFPPGTIKFDAQHPAPTALPVPFVPGALLLQGVLSPAECKQVIRAAEAIGWHSDVDYTFGGSAGDDGGRQQQQQHAPDTPPQAGGQQQQQEQQEHKQQEQHEHKQQEQASAGAAAAADADAGAATDAATDADAAAGSAARVLAAGLAGLPEGTPAAGCVWLADDSVLQPLYDRVAHLLPQQIEGGAYAGINARWRLYRYTPGAVYRPHVDGAWPGSGVDPATGEYVFDAFGDRWSRLTFLVYLNDGFEGGCTTYYTPSEQQVGVLDARGVVPVAGNVMVFPHGGTKGSLVHEGSAVLQGAKYVIRTDVLYMNPPKAAADGRGAKKAAGGSR